MQRKQPKTPSVVNRRNKDVARKFYLPETLDNYVRESARRNFRTFNGQIELMLEHARAAGL